MQIQAVEQTDKMPPMPLPTLSKEEEKGRLRTLSIVEEEEEEKEFRPTRRCMPDSQFSKSKKIMNVTTMKKKGTSKYHPDQTHIQTPEFWSSKS
jgi:hypothetical protein